MIKEHELVILTKDLPAENLNAGDVGVVVQVHEDSALVEFFSPDGEASRIATVPVGHMEVQQKPQPEPR
jgi:uncharacterized protein DUF4926